MTKITVPVKSAKTYGIDVRHIAVDVPDDFTWEAGQYVWIGHEDFEERPFSIASAPHHPHLELYVRDSGQGITHHIMNAIQEGDVLTVRGPEGKSIYQENDESRPLLAIAGGTGVAQVKAVIESALHKGGHPSVTLYYGVRFETDLHLSPYFDLLTAQHKGFAYHSVVGDYVGNVVVTDIPELSGYDVWLCGPPPMIEATLPLLFSHGLKEENLYCDYRPDKKDASA